MYNKNGPYLLVHKTEIVTGLEQLVQLSILVFFSNQTSSSIISRAPSPILPPFCALVPRLVRYPSAIKPLRVLAASNCVNFFLDALFPPGQ